LLSYSREVAANTTKHGDTLLTAKAARDFLLDLDHPQVTLGLVVIKGTRKIVQEAQHRLLLLREAVQQIASRILFGSPWFALVVLGLLGSWRRGIGLTAIEKELIVAMQQPGQRPQIQGVLAQRFGLLDRGFHLQEGVPTFFPCVFPLSMQQFLCEMRKEYLKGDVGPGNSEKLA